MTQKRFENFINGNFISFRGKRFFSKNPADRRKVLGSFPQSDRKTVNAACEAARTAYPLWSRTPWPVRADYLKKFGQEVERNEKGLARIVAQESGKALAEARADVVEARHMLEYAASFGRNAIGNIIPSEVPKKFAFTLRVPIGPTASISPWNFPIAIPTWTWAIALVAGNTVVFKPSEDTPLCGQKLAEIASRVKFPKGVFNLVHGNAQTGKALVRHRAIKNIVFTGSFGAATWIQTESIRLGKLCATEAGGKAGIVITKSANMDIAVDAALKGAYKTTGQRCVSASRFIVDEEIADEFTARFVAETKRTIRVGNPLSPETTMGPMINENGLKKVERFNAMVRRAAKIERSGITILLDGARARKGMLRHGNFLTPFIYRVDKYNSRFLPTQEEVFGPHIAIIPYRSGQWRQAFKIHNDTPYGLAGAIVSNDFEEVFDFITLTSEIGVRYANLSSVGAEVQLPFGGLKRSGNNKPSGAGILPHVTHTIAATINFGKEVVLPQSLGKK
ncbi:MAG: hypothetical protein A2806_03735 [Candidatus Terrybacteria bacterium RIFCSPHIGHO2_01_FULL_48_17]|uniref:Aldehyde dehydrogenase domain-containing protein n=1 Tax=Candidatus Terrybacteria bacterium RIFCSPHIGHO2_01_FULL_48_17 TaxID=1802362 RepID=A0A1G2PI91_9BACT|nr:MAG: hypothetical protein A2806_03735 [Candidatus Terrybacteria bacterium RIFCSPHIGHO2_01_FULL_48_17]OHA53914.1 MAG: hypothetical protein A3A30_03795 [Candidatus Terrybacteria bacterium RIFCSPLOWO2_01_FULL_48_14]